MPRVRERFGYIIYAYLNILYYIYIIFPCSSFPPAGSLHWPFGILKMQLLATSPTSG